MSFSRLGKKRTRLGGAVHRDSQAPKAPRLFRLSAEAFTLLAVFTILTAAVTEPPKFPRKSIGYDIESQAIALEQIQSDR